MNWNLKIGDKLFSLRYNFQDKVETGDKLEVVDINLTYINFYNITKNNKLLIDTQWFNKYVTNKDFKITKILTRKLNILLKYAKN